MTLILWTILSFTLVAAMLILRSYVVYPVTWDMTSLHTLRPPVRNVIERVIWLLLTRTNKLRRKYVQVRNEVFSVRVASAEARD